MRAHFALGAHGPHSSASDANDDSRRADSGEGHPFSPAKELSSPSNNNAAGNLPKSTLPEWTPSLAIWRSRSFEKSAAQMRLLARASEKGVEPGVDARGTKRLSAPREPRRHHGADRDGPSTDRGGRVNRLTAALEIPCRDRSQAVT